MFLILVLIRRHACLMMVMEHISRFELLLSSKRHSDIKRIDGFLDLAPKCHCYNLFYPLGYLLRLGLFGKVAVRVWISWEGSR